MEQSLYEDAYHFAVIQQKLATNAVFRDLQTKHPKEAFDELHVASVRAFELYNAARGFAKKIWDKSLPYERAETFLVAQFPDFPAAVCSAALSECHVDAR